MTNKAFVAILFLSLLGFANCTFIGPPDDKDLAAVHHREKALVLFRVTCDIAGEPATESEPGCIEGENATVAIGDFDSGGELHQLPILRSFSADTSKQGWTYLILDPGIYYIGFQGQRRTDAFSYNAAWKSVKRYRFDVDPNSPVIYIGTMHLECRSDWFLFGEKYCCFIDHQIIRNEETLAAKILAESFDSIEQPKTALMRLHTDKTLFFLTPKVKQ
jgi:hypothetical protein